MALKRRAEPSLQALADHLTAFTDIHTSLPMALAEATKGAAEWKGGLVCYQGLVLMTLRLHFLFSVLSTSTARTKLNGAICHELR